MKTDFAPHSEATTAKMEPDVFQIKWCSFESPKVLRPSKYRTIATKSGQAQ